MSVYQGNQSNYIQFSGQAVLNPIFSFLFVLYPDALRFPEWRLPAVIIFVENGTIRSSVETSVLVGVIVEKLFFSIFTDPLENEYQATLIF